MKNPKRKVDILVISDVHLGTYGCRAKELLHYLKSVKPGKVILNGDIVDVWQFSKRFWPNSHMKVVKHILSWISKGIPVYYITGNHDEMMRKFAGTRFGSMQIVNQLVLTLPEGKQAWFFHGDVFDITMKHARWLVRAGAIGYDALIMLNSLMNYISERVLRRGRISLSKRIKQSVKHAVSYLNQFETSAAEMGIMNGYDYIICGHIHQPQQKKMIVGNQEITYLNSGDWIEHCSALEYKNGEWQVYLFSASDREAMHAGNDIDTLPQNSALYLSLIKEFKIKSV
ncbi:MAG: UDP-2,3-diacylglucosamine diphosphatase [Ferruginibacter sp.]|nr:UDP-2,3-diacylglucosamine diphosphatase [Ferruginibacter sp.]